MTSTTASRAFPNKSLLLPLFARKYPAASTRMPAAALMNKTALFVCTYSFCRAAEIIDSTLLRAIFQYPLSTKITYTARKNTTVNTTGLIEMPNRTSISVSATAPITIWNSPANSAPKPIPAAKAVMPTKLISIM